MAMNVLVGDIGGTNTRLARARVDGVSVNLERIERFDNARYDGLETILEGFIQHAGSFERCCLAVAGPTDGRQVSFTNLDWRIDAQALAARFQFRHAGLINDFAAVGWGLNTLGMADLAMLQSGSVVGDAPRLALGAGTGLGVSLCVSQGTLHFPLASEGGHIGFAPVDAEQGRLLDFLQELHGRVSVERILSGSGIVALYRFCLSRSGLDGTDNPLLKAPNPAQAISQAGLDLTDAAAAKSLRLFAAILGQTAGDLALVAGAAGGVYIAGGIAPKLLPALQGREFLAGFNGKGRFSDWTRGLQVAVVLDPDIGMKGAAVAAGTGKLSGLASS